jgi:hypothetical protein
MKSNAQLRRDDLDDVPQPPPIHVVVLDMASSSQTAPPPPQQNAGYAQILEAFSCTSEWHKHYAADTFISAAGSSLDQPLCGAEPAGHPGVSQASSSIQQ